MIPKFTAVPRDRLVAKALEATGRATAAKLAKMTGKTLVNVRHTMNKLHKQDKVHIGGYETNSRGKLSRIWYWGDGDDVDEPLIAKDRSFFIPRADEAAAWLRNSI
jgi:hypothetical protein